MAQLTQLLLALIFHSYLSLAMLLGAKLGGIEVLGLSVGHLPLKSTSPMNIFDEYR